MSDSLQPQPWWAAVIGGVLFTIRWLVNVGASGSQTTIKSQAQDIERLNGRVSRLEQRAEQDAALIEELRSINAVLRQALIEAGVSLPA